MCLPIKLANLRLLGDDLRRKYRVRENGDSTLMAFAERLFSFQLATDFPTKVRKSIVHRDDQMFTVLPFVFEFLEAVAF